MTLVDACCNTPATKAQWQNKGQKVALSREINGEQRHAYRTGPKDSKRGIVGIYDIIGDHPTTFQFYDRLAESHGGFQILVPSIFQNGGMPDEYLGDMPKLIEWLGANGDYKKAHVDELIRIAVEDLRKAGCTSFSIVGQCWGALMAVKAASEEGNPFLAAGGPHPSFYSIETTKDTKAPLIILPSADEADLLPIIENLKQKNFPVESFHKRYDNMFHGWMGARGDWSQPDQFKAALEGIDLFGAYFAKVAEVSESKL